MAHVPQHHGKIGIVLDERLARGKKAILTRLIHTFRAFAEVEIFADNMNESKVLERIQREPFDLLLLPWYHYLAWRRVEAFYGTTRSSGPTVAGYFCEPVNPDQLGPTSEYPRTILVDFCTLGYRESGIIVRNLLQDHRRSGIRPFFRPETTVYCENWYHGQGLGMRLDTVFSLPEVNKFDWSSRAHCIRTSIVALWSLIYEEGPGKSEFRQAIAGNTPIAHFQVAMDDRAFLLRLCLQLPGTTPRSLLERFWHNSNKPGAAAQYLLKYADFIRAEVINNSYDVEVVVGLFHSAAADRMPNSIHTIWIEPIAGNLLTEPAFVAPGPDYPHLQALPEVPLSTPRGPTHGVSSISDRAKDRFIVEAANKIRDLKKIIEERETLIRELRSGGLGVATAGPPPDAESLLEAFQARYFESRYQITQFEAEIARLEAQGGTPPEIEALRQKIVTLAAREQSWIHILSKTLTHYAQNSAAASAANAKKKKGSAG